MKQFIILSIVLINTTLFAQDFTLQDGRFLFQETYYSPDGFPEFYPGLIEMVNGNISIVAPGAPFTAGIGILSVQKDGQVGIHTSAPEAGLHLKQDLSTVAGHRGIRLQNNLNNHWTIEVNETDNEIDFYYNGSRKASIKTDGTYAKASTSLVANNENSKETNQINVMGQDQNPNSRIIIQEKMIQSLEQKVKILEEKISSFIN